MTLTPNPIESLNCAHQYKVNGKVDKQVLLPLQTQILRHTEARNM